MEADPWADASPPVATVTQTVHPSTTTPAIAHEDTVDSEDFPEVPQASSSRIPDVVDNTGFEPVGGAQTIGAEEDDGFDEFDDFDAAPAAAGPSEGAEDGDGFGDFGDFEEGDFEASEAVSSIPVEQVPIQEERLPGLRLQPMPSRADLTVQLSTLLSPLLDATSPLFTSEPPRIASSSRQILPTETARDAYIQLASAPQLKPLDWTRSRVRREHLIHMGIPVNLDEVDSHRLAALPPLNISTSFADLRPAPARRSASLDERRSSDTKGKGWAVENGSAAGAMTGAQGAETARNGRDGLEARPELDVSQAEELCGIEEDQLSILPPSALRKLQDDLVHSSAQASALLAHLLQHKDSLSHDSATYNGMIQNLIANAAKAKSAQQAGSGGVFKRASVRRPVSAVGPGSGSATPRTGSPVVR